MVQQCPGSGHIWVISGHTQQPHGHIIQGSAKHCRLPFCVPGGGKEGRGGEGRGGEGEGEGKEFRGEAEERGEEGEGRRGMGA